MPKDTAAAVAAAQLSPEHLDLFLRQAAEHLAAIRKIRQVMWEHQLRIAHLQEIHSSDQEMRDDWYDACGLLGVKILEGRKLQLTQVDARSYPLLEEIWLADVKRLKAYYIWELDDAGSADHNYARAGREIRTALKTRARSSLESFQVVRAFLETQYLEDGRLAQSRPSARQMLSRKALRIWESTQNPDAMTNWFRAQLYASLFYENVIPAVVNDDRDATAAVLKAFQFSKSSENRYFVTNCFEAAVAIEFLNKELVCEIMNDPASADFSMVPMDYWPESRVMPSSASSRIRFDRDDKQLICEGVMTEQDRTAMLHEFPEPEYVAAIQQLFEQSRLGPFSDMIL